MHGNLHQFRRKSRIVGAYPLVAVDVDVSIETIWLRGIVLRDGEQQEVSVSS
jgi:hypothetical protein